MRGNLFTSAIGTLVGNPWSFPLIWAADNYVGAFVIEQFGLGPWVAGLAVWLALICRWRSFSRSPLAVLCLRSSLFLFITDHSIAFSRVASSQGAQKALRRQQKAEKQEPRAPELAPTKQIRQMMWLSHYLLLILTSMIKHPSKGGAMTDTQPSSLRLGVNIDHVATLRNARGGAHPTLSLRLCWLNQQGQMGLQSICAKKTPYQRL